MVDACGAVFSSILVLPSVHCCLNSVLFHTKCFLPVLCLMMAILSRNRRFFRLVMLDALQLFLWSLFYLLRTPICSYCWFNTDSFLPVLFFMNAILLVSWRVYVSVGWFLTSVWWFRANQVPHSPKSSAWNKKYHSETTLWLTGIFAITKQSTYWK